MTSAFGDQKSRMMTSIDNVGEGWHQLIRDLEEKLNAINPEFELVQVKEKFGGLRYYASPGKPLDDKEHEAFSAALREAEHRADHTCEICGKPGEIRTDYGWMKCLCEIHRQERIQKRQKEFRM